MYDWQSKGAPASSKGFFLARAPSVAGPYTPLSGSWNASSVTWARDVACTDPFLWRDGRGSFHAVFHCRNWFVGPGGDAGGHAFSADGVHWELAPEPAWNLTVRHTDGSNTTFFHRERPQVFIDPDTMAPAALFNAVSLANANQPFAWHPGRLRPEHGICSAHKHVISKIEQRTTNNEVVDVGRKCVYYNARVDVMCYVLTPHTNCIHIPAACSSAAASSCYRTQTQNTSHSLNATHT